MIQPKKGYLLFPQKNSQLFPQKIANHLTGSLLEHLHFGIHQLGPRRYEDGSSPQPGAAQSGLDGMGPVVSWLQ